MHIEDSPNAPQDDTSYFKTILRVGTLPNVFPEAHMQRNPPSTIKVESSIRWSHRYKAISNEKESDENGSDDPKAANKN